MHKTFTQVYIHIILAVQRRDCFIRKERKAALHRHFSASIGQRKANLIAVHSMPDHTHLLVGIQPSLVLATFIEEIKTESTEFINTTGWLRGSFHWQPGYGAFSYSLTDLETVMRNIIDQEHYHHIISFEDEFLSLLREFRIPYDKNNVFDFFPAEPVRTGPSIRHTGGKAILDT